MNKPSGPKAAAPFSAQAQIRTALQTEITAYTMIRGLRTSPGPSNVLLVGDLNARTGCEPDIVDPAGNSHIFGQSSLHLTPTTSHRHNQDPVVNKMGKELVHLCCSLGLYMLTGRMKGDSGDVHILLSSWD